MKLAGDISNRTVLVTGSSTGIGRKLAVNLAGQGARVVVNGRSAERLIPVTAEIEASGGEVLSVEADVRDPEAVDALLHQTLERFGSLDGVVHSAGGTYNSAAEDISPHGWDTVISENLSAAFFIARAAFPHLRDRQSCGIVFVGSIAGLEPGPGHVHYSVAKAGVVHLTRVLAYEWGKYQVRVNCICPGVISTPISAFVGDPEKEERWRRRVPLRVLGDPDDIVDMTLVLLGPGSRYTTGAVIRIDGGPRSGTANE
jgi:NAD(P)-dependent dehydrogenase (short-subunit alcohol dehydrogenase family)